MLFTAYTFKFCCEDLCLACEGGTTFTSISVSIRKCKPEDLSTMRKRWLGFGLVVFIVANEFPKIRMNKVVYTYGLTGHTSSDPSTQ